MFKECWKELVDGFLSSESEMVLMIRGAVLLPLYLGWANCLGRSTISAGSRNILLPYIILVL